MTIAMFVLAILFVAALVWSLTFAIIEEITGMDALTPGISGLIVAAIVGLALAVLTVINFGIGG